MEFIYELLFVFYHQTLHTPQISIENATSFNIVNPVANVRPPKAANPHKSRKYLPRVFHTNFVMFKTAYFVAGTTIHFGRGPIHFLKHGFKTIRVSVVSFGQKADS